MKNDVPSEPKNLTSIDFGRSPDIEMGSTQKPFKKVNPRVISKCSPSPMPWTGKEPAFKIGTDGGFFGINEIHPKDLIHTLSVGGTGSGKTVSSVIPLLNAQLRYGLPTCNGMKRSSILVIDPKHELLDTVRYVLADQGESDRLIVLGAGHCVRPVQFFSADECLSNQEKLAKIDAILGTAEMSEGSHGYWHTSAMQILERFMNLEEAFRETAGKSLVKLWIERIGKNSSREALRPTSGYWASLLEVLNSTRCGRAPFRWANTNLKEMLKEVELNEHPDAGVMDAFQEESDLLQWHYRMQSADPVIRLLADPAIGITVDLDPFPSSNEKSLDLRGAMDAGLVVLFQPSPDKNTGLAARAIKTKWYAAIRTRSDMSRPVGVVIDEFQKFITLDEASGDANFLDVARGYRCNGVFATQSVEALLNTLKSSHHAEAAVAAIVANTPSKFFFASKDKKTEAVLRSLIPDSPGGGPHIVSARPPAMMKPGEAYWSMADGRWGRGRVNIDGLN